MDALARLAPVARPLLRDVDNALATLGAPPEHPVWALLRRMGSHAGRRGRPSSPTSIRTGSGQPARRYAIGALSLRERHCPGRGAVGGLGGAALRGPADSLDRLPAWGAAPRLWPAGCAPPPPMWTLWRTGTSGAATRSRGRWPRCSRPARRSRSGRCRHSAEGSARCTRAADPAGGLARAVTAAADIGAALLGAAEDAVRPAAICTTAPGRCWPSSLTGRRRSRTRSATTPRSGYSSSAAADLRRPDRSRRGGVGWAAWVSSAR